jgi:hypothetical protein
VSVASRPHIAMRLPAPSSNHVALAGRKKQVRLVAVLASVKVVVAAALFTRGFPLHHEIFTAFTVNWPLGSVGLHAAKSTATQDLGCIRENPAF